ncbi:metal ABC transporter solute-binding protein, Zn/Mn family [Thermococcus sp.]
MRVTILLILLLISMTLPLTTASEEKPVVVTSITPLASIVREAFGDSVDVVYLIPLGIDPHEYQLTAQQVEMLGKADVIVTTGGHLPAEQRMVELQKEGLIRGKVLLIEDYKKFGFRYMKEHWYNEKNNPHGIWLDPYNAIAIAEAVKDALIEQYPANANIYGAEFEKFRIKVESIADAYTKTVSDMSSRLKAVIQMPPDQYAVEWLGIKVISSIKPEEEVPAEGVDDLLRTAKNATLIVYSSSSSEQLKKAALELSAKSGRPLADITVFWKDRPYTEVLEENTANIIKALSGNKVVEEPIRGNNWVAYVLASLIVGIVLGTAIGFIIKE